MLRRNSLEITSEILKIAESGSIKTRIVYRANLNFKVLKSYTRALVDSGLLREENKRLVTTDKGFRFLKTFNLLKGDLPK